MTTESGESQPILPPTILFHDTGINPYHEDFRWPDGFNLGAHPGFYPDEVTLLEITLNADSYEEALEADHDLWESLEPGRLYGFNGTRIIAAIHDVTCSSPPCNDVSCGSRPCILDRDGHGTAVASAAAGARDGSCPECRIAVYGPARQHSTWMGWAHELPWIDAISSSFGNLGGLGLIIASDGHETKKWTDGGRPWFVASGNGLGASTHFGDMQGPPWTFNVGHYPLAYNTNRGFDVVAPSDVEVARRASLDEYWTPLGTSISSPQATGHAMMLLWEARKIFGDPEGWRDGVLAQTTDLTRIPATGPLSDGKLTHVELEDLLRSSAREPPPETFPQSAPFIPPGEYSYWAWGFGLVDQEAMELAYPLLRGEVEPPEKPWEWWWHEVDQYIRYRYAGWIPYCIFISDPLPVPGCIVNERPDLTELPPPPPKLE